MVVMEMSLLAANRATRHGIDDVGVGTPVNVVVDDDSENL